MHFPADLLEAGPVDTVVRVVQYAGVHGGHVKVLKITWGTFTSKLLKKTVQSLFTALLPTRLKVFDMEEIDWRRFGIKVRTEILEGLKNVLSVQDSLEASAHSTSTVILNYNNLFLRGLEIS